MKAIPAVAVLSMLSIGLLGCSSADTRSSYAAPAAVGSETAAVTESRTVLNTRYMEEVEKLARQQGVRVHWVNPPVKRVSIVSR